MAHISLRVSEEEKEWMESYAEINGISLSDALKLALLEKMEDEHDLKIIKEYENEKDTINFCSHDAMKNILGI